MTEENSKMKGTIRKGHGHRNDLVGEHRFSDIGQLLFLAVFLTIWILDSFVFHFSDFLDDYIPLYVKLPIACIILVISGYFAFMGLKKVFREKRDSPEVIKSGVFAYSRHPIYLGSILVYLGWILLTFSLSSLGIWIIIIIFYEFIATYEETLLLQQFGEEYVKYKKEVSKWIPWKKLYRRKKEKKEN